MLFYSKTIKRVIPYINMEKEELTLTQFMLREHGEIFELLATFRRDVNHLNDFKKAFKSLKKLRKKQENHAYGEEKAIFNFYARNKKKKYPALTKVLKQHEEIAKLNKKLQFELDNEKNPIETAKAQNYLLKEHVALEDREFYPFLEKELNKEQQKEIIGKFNEVVLGNISAEGPERI